MILAATAIAFALLRQDPAPPTWTSTVGGKEVKWSFQTPAVPTLPNEVLNWDGWGFLPAAGRYPGTAFRSYVLPPGLDERYKAAHAKVNASTPVWHAKAVFFRESDILDRDDQGVVRRRYSTLEPFQVDEMLSAFARFAALVEILTDGQLQIKADVDNDTTMMQFDRFAGSAAWDDRFAEQYFGPRLNGPGFTTTDKAYRGPYQSVFYVHSGLSGAGTVDTIVQGSPVTGLAFPLEAMIPTPGSLDASLLLAWERHAHMLAASQGAPADSRPSTEDMALLCKPDLTPEEQGQLMTPHQGATPVLAMFPKMFAMAPVSANVEPKIVKDAQRGDVLSYSESGLERSGGLAVPLRGDAPLISVRETPHFQFWVKSVSDEPLAISLFVNGSQKLELVLGRNDPPRTVLEESSSSLRVVRLPFTPDGKWQHVGVDLAKYLSDSTGWSVTGMRIGPPTNALRFGKSALGKIEYEFDDFTATQQASEGIQGERPAPAPSAVANDPESKCLFLAGLSNDSSKGDLEAALRLLSDPDPWVKLNAIDAFTRVQYPAAFVTLFELTKSLNTRFAQLAVRAVAHQDTPTGWALVKKVLEDGAYDVAREEAAKALGALKDPSYAGALSTTVDSRSRYDKIAAAQAIAGLPGNDAPQILMAFINDGDPQVRLTVVRLANLAVPSVRQIVAFTAANDTSDKVRAASYLRLLESADPSVKAEGAKGTEDEGELVRQAVLWGMAAHPDEANRSAIRAALADPSAAVRAAALRSLATLPNGIAPGEAPENDPNPWVQDALLDLAASRSLKLSDSALQAMRASKVPRIAAKAKAVS